MQDNSAPVRNENNKPNLADHHRILLNTLDYQLQAVCQRLDHGEPCDDLISKNLSFYSGVFEILVDYLSRLISKDTESDNVRSQFSNMAAVHLLELLRFQDKNVLKHPEWFEQYAKKVDKWPILCPPQTRFRNELTKKISDSIHLGCGEIEDVKSSVTMNVDPTDRLFIVSELVRHQRFHVCTTNFSGPRQHIKNFETYCLPPKELIKDYSISSEKNPWNKDKTVDSYLAFKECMEDLDYRMEMNDYDLILFEESEEASVTPIRSAPIPSPPFTRESFELWLNDFLMPNYECFTNIFLMHPAFFTKTQRETGYVSERRKHFKKVVSDSFKRIKSLQEESW